MDKTLQSNWAFFFFCQNWCCGVGANSAENPSVVSFAKLERKSWAFFSLSPKWGRQSVASLLMCSVNAWRKRSLVQWGNSPQRKFQLEKKRKGGKKTKRKAMLLQTTNFSLMTFLPDFLPTAHENFILTQNASTDLSRSRNAFSHEMPLLHSILSHSFLSFPWCNSIQFSLFLNHLPKCLRFWRVQKCCSTADLFRFTDHY